MVRLGKHHERDCLDLEVFGRSVKYSVSATAPRHRPESGSSNAVPELFNQPSSRRFHLHHHCDSTRVRGCTVRDKWDDIANFVIAWTLKVDLLDPTGLQVLLALVALHHPSSTRNLYFRGFKYLP